jgi:hypothetical protein
MCLLLTIHSVTNAAGRGRYFRKVIIEYDKARQ